MIVAYEVSKRNGSIRRREYIRETATRYYYQYDYGRRLAGESWTKKEDCATKTFTDFEAARAYAIERASYHVTSARQNLAIAEELYERALKATEESVK